jgi:three-Cys-motif partner protein
MPRRHRSNHFVEFQPHTRYKHLILQHYLERWVRKVLAGRPEVRRVVMVDAFAGAGRDEVGNDGSPLRMARVAAESEGQLSRILGRPVRVEVVLIEKDVRHRDALRHCMVPFGDRVEILDESLATHLGHVLARYGDAPMIFFLDPYGIADLNADLITTAIGGAGREVFMLVDDDGATRLARVAVHQTARRIRQLRAQAAQNDLFEDNDARRRRIDEQAAAVQRQRDRTGALVAPRLTQALGSEESWRRIATLLTGAERREAVVDQFERLLVLADAPFTTRIPVRSASGRLEYVLLHASRVPDGRSTMKTEVQSALAQCDLPEEVIQMLRADASLDLETVVAHVVYYYSGREAAWPEREPDSIREHILQHTHAFPWHLDAIEDRLKGARLPPARTREAVQLSAC